MKVIVVIILVAAVLTAAGGWWYEESKLARLGGEKLHLEWRLSDVESQLTDSAKALNSATLRLAHLEKELTTLKGANQSLAEIRAEIKSLESQRKALVPRTLEVELVCTGSMDPTITCLDRAWVVTNPREYDITIGSVVSFNSDCFPAGMSIFHRVIAIKQTATGQEFLTKGDNNPTDDGCWIRFAEIGDYLLRVEKNAYSTPERDAVMQQIREFDLQLAQKLLWLEITKGEVETLFARWDGCFESPSCNAGIARTNELIQRYNTEVKRFDAIQDSVTEARRWLQRSINPRHEWAIE